MSALRWRQLSWSAAAHVFLLERVDYPSKIVTGAKDQRSDSFVWRKGSFLVDGMALPAHASIFAWYPVAGNVCNISCGLPRQAGMDCSVMRKAAGRSMGGKEQ